MINNVLEKNISDVKIKFTKSKWIYSGPSKVEGTMLIYMLEKQLTIILLKTTSLFPKKPK